MADIENKVCYFELIRKAMPIVYRNHSEPKIADYEAEVANLINKKLPIKSIPYTKRGVHASVYRKIKWLTEHGEMKTDGKKHYWGLEEYEQYIKLDTFNKNVGVLKNTVGVISGTTYTILLDPSYDLLKSKEEIEKKLGKDNFYATFLLENVIVIVLNDNSHNEIVADLIDAVKNAYDFQHNKAKKDG